MRLIVVVLACGGLAACSPDSVMPSATATESSPTHLAWSCYDPSDPHCSPTPPPGDPFPSAPGVFLGEDFSISNCMGGTDLDQDGLMDFCEYQLAVSFRPLLATDPTDHGLGGEPAWAAGLSVEGIVGIAYLFSYYDDWGNNFDCNPMGWWCDGHLGDSEFVIVTLYYNEGTQHWVFLNMFTSAHYGTQAESSQWSYDFETEFPAHSAWYPRVWVARNKHANYTTRSLCNAGAFWTDTCQSNQDAGRFYVNPNRNVGSSVRPRIDSIYSSSYRTGKEYYWNSNHRFCGWDAGGRLNPANCAQAYGVILRNFGF
jgi:hypothetical protein